MKAFVYPLLYSLIAVLIFSSPTLAMVDISEIGMGARPLGLGRAFVGGADDATAIFTNPAGLVTNPHLNLISMSGKLLNDINYTMVGLSENSPLGKIGIGYVNASVGGIPLTTLSGSGSTAAVVQTGTTDYSSSIIYLSYSTKLDRVLLGRVRGLSLGTSLKYFLQGFSGGGSAMQEATGVGLDADLGLLWRIYPWASVGATFTNFLPTGFGGKFEWQKENEVEAIQMSTRLGAQFKLLGEEAILKHPSHKLDFFIDYEKPGQPNYPSLQHMGLEYWPTGMLAFRAGLSQKPKAGANNTSVAVDNNMSAGVGIRFFGFTFDYAYMRLGELSDNMTHFFSFGYRGWTKPKRKRGVKAKKPPNIPMAEVVEQPQLKSYLDIADDYWAKKPIEYLASLGIMGGYPDQTFRPDQPVSRAELAVLLVKAKGFKVQRSNRSGFKDVSAGNWNAPYIAKAVERQYMKGYPDGTFRPTKKVNRAEAALIFARYAGLYIKNRLSAQVYTDVGRKHWASPAIAAGKRAGFFEYLGNSEFELDKDLTRAEAAEILSKAPFVRQKIKKLISGEQ